MSVMIRVGVTFVAWLVLSIGLGVLVSAADPHGMSAFIYTSSVLGVIGGAASSLASAVKRGRWATWRDVCFGAVCGVIAFPLSTLLDSGAPHPPYDLFQWGLLAFLCAAGGLMGWLVNHIIFGNLRRRHSAL